MKNSKNVKIIQTFHIVHGPYRSISLPLVGQLLGILMNCCCTWEDAEGDGENDANCQCLASKKGTPHACTLQKLKHMIMKT